MRPCGTFEGLARRAEAESRNEEREGVEQRWVESDVASDHAFTLNDFDCKNVSRHKKAHKAHKISFVPFVLLWLLLSCCLRGLDGAFFVRRFLAFLFRVGLALLSGGVFDFGVHFTANQDRGAGEVEPQHQYDHCTE